MSLFIIRWKRISLYRRDYEYGILQGACNLLGTFSLAMTLKYLPGTLVFPFTSVAGVAMTTVAGMVVWKEELRRPAYVGIELAVIALVLVNGE